MFNSLNKEKIRDIKNAHENLRDDEVLRVFTGNVSFMDFKHDEKIIYKKNKLIAGTLVLYISEVVFFDTLKLLNENPIEEEIINNE